MSAIATTSPGLALLGRQLWAATEDAGLTRLVASRPGRRPDAGGWDVVESYWAVPRAESVRLLVPAGPAPATTAALVGYRRLRPTRERWVRQALGLGSRLGLPPGAARVDLQVRRDADPSVREDLPLAVVGRALGSERLYAAIGIRPGPNGKPTLQLVDAAGRHRGYAKLGWNAHTDDFVTTETATLRELAGGGPGMRVPGLLASGEAGGHPWVVTEPLPEGVVALRGRDASVTPGELAALTPVVRRDTPAGTRQVQGIVARLSAAAAAGPDDLVARTKDLAARVREVALELPVTARWHGDLTPWNCARGDDGQLWCWDWETCEPDVVAGLDALHWAVSVRRERAGGIEGVSLATGLADAEPHLRAAGVGRRSEGVVAGVYALTVAERALGLAARAGWERSWIAPEQVARIADEGRGLLEASTRPG